MKKIKKRHCQHPPPAPAKDTQTIKLNGQTFTIAPLTVKQVSRLGELPRNSTEEIRAWGLWIIVTALNNASVTSDESPETVKARIDIFTYGRLLIAILELTGLDASGLTASLAQLETGAAVKSPARVN